MTARRSLSIHRLTNGGAPAAALALLTAMVAIALLAIPVALDDLATAQLRQQISTLPADSSALTSTALAQPEMGPAPGAPAAAPNDTASLWGGFEARLAGLRAASPEPLRSGLGPAEFLITADPMLLQPVSGQPPAHLYVDPAVDPDFADHARLVDGRWPNAQLVPPADENAGSAGQAATRRPIELALSVETARQMGWATGQSRFSQLLTGTLVEFRLTGVFQPAPASDAYWVRHPSVLTPRLAGRDLELFVYATAVVHPVSWPVVRSFDANAVMRIAIPFSTDRATAEQQPVLRGQLATFLAAPHPMADITEPGILTSVRFTSSSPAALAAAAAGTAAARAVLIVILVAPVGAALALLIAAATLLAARHRRVDRLLLWRGVRPGRLRFLAALQGILYAAVPGAVAVAVALRWWRPSGPTELVWPAIALVVPPIVLAWGLPRPGSTSVRSAQAALAGDRRARRRRRWTELGVFLVAVASAALLVRNGAGTGAGDPLLVAAPVLVGVVIFLLVRRAEPWSVRTLHGRFARGRGLTAFLGSAQDGRGPGAGAPLVAVGFAAATIVIATVLLGTVDRGIGVSARATVGADLRVDDPALTDDDIANITKIPGVRVAAAISSVDTYVMVNGLSHPVTVYVAPVAELAEVQQGVSGAATGGPAVVDGNAVVVSDSLAGARLTSSVTGRPLTVAGQARTANGLGRSTDWILVDTTGARDFAAPPPTPDEILIALDSGADPATVATAVATISGPGTVRSTAALIGPLTAAPVVRGSRAFVLIALLATALFTLLAFVVTVIAGTPARRGIVGLLRTLGLDRRGGRALIGWELAPVALVGLISGSLAGVIDVVLLRSAIDLRPLSGNGPAPQTVVDWWSLLFYGAGLGLVVALSVLLAAAVARRSTSADVLRFGER